MSMVIDRTVARNVVARWNDDRTQELLSDMQSEMRSDVAHGGFGHNVADKELGLSLAASLRDPLFWRKLNELLGYRFDNV